MKEIRTFTGGIGKRGAAAALIAGIFAVVGPQPVAIGLPDTGSTDSSASSVERPSRSAQGRPPKPVPGEPRAGMTPRPPARNGGALPEPAPRGGRGAERSVHPAVTPENVVSVPNKPVRVPTDPGNSAPAPVLPATAPPPRPAAATRAADATPTVPVRQAPVVTDAPVVEPVATVAAVTAVTPSASASSAPVMAAPPPAAAPGVVESAIAPLLGSDPGAPVQSPVSWVMLAAARRELGAAQAGRAPAATVTTGQPLARAVGVNVAPVISDVALSKPNAATGAVTGTVKAADPNGDTITYTAATSAKGKASISAAGVFTYTPTVTTRHGAAKVGATTSATTDTVRVTVTDSRGAATTKAVVVPVSPKNAVPVITRIVGTPDATSAVVTGSVQGTDADRDALTYTAPPTTAKGTVSITSTGAFTYTPTAAARHAAARNGAVAADKADTFTVTVKDGYGASVAVPISVSVSPQNTAPT
ncbi:MAG: hypothetical protein FGM52_16650, partial [Mycobacterium sp.]|nr:hypothetical protein [Mycobacterium sp.]